MKPVRASASAIVIGGGVIGLFTAWRLRDAGFCVTVVERGRIGGSASWAAGGILSPLPPWQAAEAVWKLAASSIAAYPDLVAQLHEASGIDPEWTRCGMRVQGEQKPDAALRWAAAMGLTIERGVADVLHLPWVAQLRSPRLLKALRVHLGQLGVEWHEQATVAGFSTHAGRVQAVCLADGTSLSADVIVLCAGAWSGELGALAALTLPVAPVRGQMLLFKAAPGLLHEIILDGGHYLIPRRDGSILVGSTLEHVGFNDTITAQARVQLLEAAYSLLPALQACPVSHHWAALRPGSDQGVPIIEKAAGLGNLFINTGHFRNGITLAPASAIQLAALVGATQAG